LDDATNELNEQILKVERLQKRTPIQELTYAEVKAKIHEFRAQWYRRHGREVSLADAKAGLLPTVVLELYDRLGSLLSPEQIQQDVERARAREAAAKEEAAKKEAEAEARAAERAKERAKEWEEFEQNRETLWKSAATEAQDQREEAAGGKLGALALTGASTWVKVDEPPKRSASHPTKEEYLQQMRDAFGMTSGPEDQTEALREEAEWAAKGGAEADEAARQEAWARAEAQTQAEAQTRAEAQTVEAR